MSTQDTANLLLPPPLAWALAIAAGFAADWLYPLPLSAPIAHGGLIGGLIFAAALGLALWAVATFRRTGTSVRPYVPTAAIATDGPYRFSRNPMYLAMLLSLVGLAVAFAKPWLLAMMAPLYLVLRYGVIAREETYLERKFGNAYLDFKARVRRWM